MSVSSERRPQSDEQLARESQAGSLEAFEELVSRYEHRVYGFVLRSCSNATDAREITQDTFVKAYQALEQFNPANPFAPWLFTIARRKCIDHHRSLPPKDDAPVPDGPNLDDPAELLSRKEESAAIWERAQRLLPETQFQALWLRYTEEMSVKQIAQVLRKTQTHVKVLLFRARQRLVAELESAEKVGVAASLQRLHNNSQPANPALSHACGRAPASKRVKNWEPAPSIRTL
jgi:RNA polymerase sigma-70 factor (ECF subfamily)